MERLLPAHKCRPLRIFILISGIVCTTIGSIMFTMIDKGRPYDNDVNSASAMALRRHIEQGRNKLRKLNITYDRTPVIEVLQEPSDEFYDFQSVENEKRLNADSDDAIQAMKRAERPSVLADVKVFTPQEILGLNDNGEKIRGNKQLSKKCVIFMMSFYTKRKTDEGSSRRKRSARNPICLIPGRNIKQRILKRSAIILRQVGEILKDDISLEFVDVNSDFGLYALTTAMMKHNMTSINTNRTELRQLAVSLGYNGAVENATLIWASVSKHNLSNGAIFNPYLLKPENGTIHVDVNGPLMSNNSTNADVKVANTTENHTAIVNLNNFAESFQNRRLFLKLGDDAVRLWDVLNNADHFFMVVDVRYILISLTQYRFEVDVTMEIVKLLSEMSYVPYRGDVRSEKLTIATDAMFNWPDEVLWIKQ